MTAVFQILARFQPQAWVEGSAVDVEGARDVDVTDKILGFAEADSNWLRDLEDASDASDDLIGSPRTQGHDGPFTVSVVQAAARAFGVNALDEVTQDMVRERREARERPGATQPGVGGVNDVPDVDGADDAGVRSNLTQLADLLTELPAQVRFTKARSSQNVTAPARAQSSAGRTRIALHVDAEWFVDAATRHGEDSGPEHEAGDMQSFFRAAWDLMTAEQRQAFLSAPAVQGAVAGATGVHLARKLSDLHRGEWEATVAGQRLPHGLRRESLTRQDALDCVNAQRLSGIAHRG